MPLEPRDQLAEARKHLKNGDYLTAFDLAETGLEQGVRDPALIHLAALSLARSGATNQALAYLARYEDDLPDTEEFGALKARLLKDRFKGCRDQAEKRSLGRQARDAYKERFERSRGYFSGINAATLSLLIGDTKVCCSLAGEVMDICRTGNEKSYWLHATRAEACLLLERDAEAQEHLAAALALSPNDHAARSTTYQQLALICTARGLDPALIESIRAPAVIHYTGHMIHGVGRSPGMDPQDEPRLREQIRTALDEERVGFAYGSLACGADIVIAESVLEGGGELHVVLPFAKEAFRSMSVAPAGPEWEARFDRALGRAASTTHIVDAPCGDDEFILATGATQAMGMARIRAEHLGSRVLQLALWDQQPGSSSCGAATDVSRWREYGLDSRIIKVPAPRAAGTHAESAPPARATAARRQLKAMIFADVKGYSALPEAQLPVVVPAWLKRLAELTEKHVGDVAAVETWGDAVYLVVDRVRVAAEIGLELSTLLSDKEWRDMGLPDSAGLRVSAHVGPVFVGLNPVLGQKAFFGPHVTRAARMEPCTPVGAVYVTEAFAALLALEAGDEYRCEYAGHRPLAKDYGVIRMYHLARR